MNLKKKKKPPYLKRLKKHLKLRKQILDCYGVKDKGKITHGAIFDMPNDHLGKF